MSFCYFFSKLLLIFEKKKFTYLLSTISHVNSALTQQDKVQVKQTFIFNLILYD